MALPTQRIVPGRLDQAYRQEWNRLSAAEAIPKIWSKQASLWKDDSAHATVIANRLGWIPVLDAMRGAAAALKQFASEAAASGMLDIVLLGMGGSSLAPEVFSLTFPAPSAGHRFFVLDTTDPTSLLEFGNAVDLPHALFVVASKSGKTIETLSQYVYFQSRLQQAGVRATGQNFIAITDAKSHLDSLATEGQFLHTFRNPDDIGGRYSALSYFGLVPAALWGVDVGALLDSAIAMRAACAPQADANANPALQLGALLGAAARQGDDKLVLLSTPKLTPLGNWIEQLVAESTGKEGKGIVPVAGGANPPVEVLASGCLTVALVLEGDEDTTVKQKIDALEKQGAPVAEIRLANTLDLGAEFFKWETATAVAGASLAIDPFDEPNVQESKDATARILEQFQSSGEMPLGSPRLTESGIALYAEAAVRGSISLLHLGDALRTFFAEKRPDDYLAVLAYVDRDAANGAELDALRAFLCERSRLPVLLGYGPRYMHSIGQLYKGGPLSGMFLVITSEKASDLAIPGAKYTFGQLQMAQALGDLQSLGRHDKPALRLHLTQGAPAGLVQLRKVVEQALGHSRPAA